MSEYLIPATTSTTFSLAAQDWPELARRLHLVNALAAKWEREAQQMALVGGESPRPRDFSEGHYVGTMKSYEDRAAELRAVLEASLRSGPSDS